MMDNHKGALELRGEAENGEEAIVKVNDLQPDLLFLDIQLPDMNGFELLRKIKHQPTIIFTTAYEEYAIKAFDELAIDYLLKPIREERFNQSIEKLSYLGKLNTPYNTNLEILAEALQKKKVPTAFPVKLGDKIILLPFDSISYFEADDKYVRIFTVDAVKYLTDLPLNKLIETLPPEFVRIQKSFIINKNKIKELNKFFNGRFIFVMNDKAASKIKSGLTFHDGIKAEFGL
jgi:two-component system LytT family response regulator